MKADPTKTDIGPVDENRNYVLHATNVCGGSLDQTAAVHVTGSIEPIPDVVLQSVFYPTDYPDKKNPQVGLVKSQQLELATLAAGFKKYLEYDPDAKLSVEAYADIRGSKPHNQDLSERRVERIKQYLVDQGISADKVQTAAYGKERPMDKADSEDPGRHQPEPGTQGTCEERHGRHGSHTTAARISCCCLRARSRRSSIRTTPTILRDSVADPEAGAEEGGSGAVSFDYRAAADFRGCVTMNAPGSDALRRVFVFGDAECEESEGSGMRTSESEGRGKRSRGKQRQRILRRRRGMKQRRG